MSMQLCLLQFGFKCSSPEQRQLQGEGPLHGSFGLWERYHEGALLLLALIASTQKQASAHTRLEPPKRYQGLLLVNP
jgi:hypothetical protein